jgi:hypothetical protein
MHIFSKFAHALRRAITLTHIQSHSCIYGPVVQWIECQIPVLVVVGSNPAGITFKFYNPL